MTIHLRLPITTHSTIAGGSTIERRKACPASGRMESGIREVTSDSAIEGTVLHASFERMFYDAMFQENPVGSTFEVPVFGPKSHFAGDSAVKQGHTSDESGAAFAYKDFELTNNHVQNVLYPAVDAIQGLCDEVGGFHWFETELKVSAKVHMGDGVSTEVFGTVDYFARGLDGSLWIIDLKTGYRDVQATENMQLMFYAWLLYENDRLEPDHRINLAIVQPLRSPVLRTEEVSLLEIEEAGHNFKEVVRKVMHNWKCPPAQREFNVGSHCTFCKAKPVCREFAKSAHKTTVDMMNMPVASLSDEQLSKLKSFVPTVEAMIKLVDHETRTRLSMGYDIPGYYLSSRNYRSWRDPDAAYEAEKRLRRYVKVAGTFVPRKLISPAQAEKRVGKERYNKIFAKFVKTAPGKSSVKRRSPKPSSTVNPTALAKAKWGK